jgi:hypothetical protein
MHSSTLISLIRERLQKIQKICSKSALIRYNIQPISINRIVVLYEPWAQMSTEIYVVSVKRR